MCVIRGMNAADVSDEDDLLDYDLQMMIQESCQREQSTGPGRYIPVITPQFEGIHVVIHAPVFTFTYLGPKP